MALWDRFFSRSSAPAPVEPVEEKASSVGSIVANVMLGRPVWPQRDFARLARDGYQRNVIVYSCVWLIARAAAQVPLCVVKRTSTGDTASASAPNLIALLDRPNPVQDGVAFRQDVISDYILSGNAFTERVDALGLPRELYRLRPDRVKIVPGKDGWPEAYEFKVAGGTKLFKIDPSKPGGMPVWHMKDYSPVNDWYGMSPLDPAAFSVDSHTGTEAWNKALLDNGARPSGALVYAPKDGGGKLTAEQRSMLSSSLEQAYSGPANAGRPLLLDGGMTWVEMGLSPKDMDFVAGKNSSARDIALAMGVPPMLLGIPGDNTYSNYQEANKAFYRSTVLPVLGQWCRGMSYWIAEGFGQGLMIEPDVDDLPAFSDERAALWTRVQSADFLTVNEKRAAVGLKPTPGGDVILMPSSMIPLEDAGATISGGAADGTDDADAEGAGGSGDDESGTVEAEDE